VRIRLVESGTRRDYAPKRHQAMHNGEVEHGCSQHIWLGI
jgi:hypothetical protein